MLIVLILFGLQFFFNKDEKKPLHINVSNKDGKAIIDVLTDTVVENTGIKPEDMQKALDTVARYKSDIIKAWHQYFGD